MDLTNVRYLFIKFYIKSDKESICFIFYNIFPKFNTKKCIIKNFRTSLTLTIKFILSNSDLFYSVKLK